MLQFTRISGLTLSSLMVCGALFAQMPTPKNPAAPNGVAALVNGHPIREAAVERALGAVPPEDRAKVRADVIQYLAEQAIIDQYLIALKINVAPNEVEAKITLFKADLKEHKEDYALMLQKMRLTEAELKDQIHDQLRWEKFVTQQATDAKLKALFDAMPEAFDGTTVRARHILLQFGTTEKTKQEAMLQLQAIKAQIEKDWAVALAKLPADADNLTKEKKRIEFIEETFGAYAKKYSTCPSKNEGGDLRWFPRCNAMVEPFAKVAFALKPYQISEVVTTPFGYHLILVTARKAGTAVKFEDEKVKEAVKEVYEARLKDAVLDQMKPRAKVEIMPAPK